MMNKKRIETVGELKEFLKNLKDDTLISMNMQESEKTYLNADGTIKLEHDKEGNYLYINAEVGSVLG